MELCLKCNQPNTKKMWCQPCDLKYFRQNFKNWASSSDKIISESAKKILEWIPYEQLRNIKYLSKGGFGTIFKAEWINNKAIEHWKTEFNQWEEDKFKNYVALKVLDNSQNIKVDFLKETICYKLTKDNIYIVKCHGISQDPKSKNYIMVMDYIPHGDLRKYLQNNYNNLDFRDKIDQLYSIASGLSSIHEKELLHRDFHSGNILNDGRYNYITDLGLCRPVNEKDERNKVYGVLPYVAPEVLRGEKYTQASDIYSFGIIAYEVFFGKSPYSEFAHDEFLAMKICQGLRPNLDCIKIPKKCENLIKKCWDAEPNKKTLGCWNN